MTETFCIFIVVILVFFYIIDVKHGMEHFKSEQKYEQKYLNDPNKINQFIKQKEEEESKLKYRVDSLTSINKIQSNTIYSNKKQVKDIQTYVNHPQIINKTQLIDKTQRNQSEEKNKYSDINIGLTHKNFNKSNKKNPNLQKVNFNPIVSNPESKYKLYHDSLFTPNPAPKLYNEHDPIIDQTINTNIQNYINKGIQSVPIDYANPSNTSAENIDLGKVNMKGKTIKEIYDEITQDSRLDLQKNLDDLQAFNNRNDYMLGEKYGATRFDTYALG